MRKHHLAGMGAATMGLGVLVGVIVTGHREAGGVDHVNENTVHVKLIDRCGHLVMTSRGVPVEVELPLVPPGAVGRSGAQLPDRGDGGTSQVVVVPPYQVAYAHPAPC
jgi:hypothetical protein